MGEIWLHSDYQSAGIKNVSFCIRVEFRFSTSVSVMTIFRLSMPLKFHLMFKNEAKMLSGGFVHFLTVSIQFSQLPIAIDSQI